MSKLTTAEEIVADFEECDLSPRLGFATDPGVNSPTMVNWRKDMVLEVRDIQYKTAQHCLKVVLLCLVAEGVLESSEPIDHGKPKCGACCMCQTCRYHCDDCVCQTNRVLGALKATFAKLAENPAPAGEVKP